MKKLFPILLTVLVISGLTFGGGFAFLGTMLKLGTTTTAARPASSTAIKGALLYDTDVNAPIYNTGSAWTAIGSGGGGEYYWFDAGVFGAAQANATQVSMGNPGNISVDGGYFDVARRSSVMIFNEDAGISLVIGSSTSDSDATATRGYTMSIINYVGAPSIGFWKRTNAGGFFGPTASIEASTAYGGSSGGLNFTTETNSDGFMFRVGTGRNQPLMSVVAPSNITRMNLLGTVSGNDALRFDVAGARLHFSAGTGADYLFSDGVGTISGSYFKVASFATTALPSASGVGAGAIAYSLDAGSLYYTTSNAWLPLPPVYRATFTGDAGSVGAATTRDETIAVPGAVADATCMTGAPSGQTAGIITNCFVSATGVVTFRYANVTGSPAVPVVGTYAIGVTNP